MLNKLIFLLFLLTSTVATAQTDSISKPLPLPAYGMKAGLNFSRVVGNGALPEEAYTGGGGGVFGLMVAVPITHQLSTEINLFYSGKGYNAAYNAFGPDSVLYDHRAAGRFSYLELPVLLQLNLPEKSRRFTLVAGPHFAFLLRRQEEVRFRANKKQQYHFAEGREGANAFTMGYSFGAHLNLRLFRLGFRYGADVTSLGKKGRPYFGSPMRLKLVQLELAFLVGTIKPKYTGKPF